MPLALPKPQGPATPGNAVLGRKTLKNPSDRTIVWILNGSEASRAPRTPRTSNTADQ